MQMTYEEVCKELQHPTSCYLIDGIIDEHGRILCPQCFCNMDDESDGDARYTPIINGVTYETEDDSTLECDECGTVKIMDGWNI